MSIAFPDDYRPDPSLYEDDFDYDAWLLREFGDDETENDPTEERQERLLALMWSLPANVVALTCCLMLWGSVTIGIARVVADVWKELKTSAEQKEQTRQQIQEVLEKERPKRP